MVPPQFHSPPFEDRLQLVTPAAAQLEVSCLLASVQTAELAVSPVSTMLPLEMEGPVPVTHGPSATPCVPSQMKCCVVSELAALAIVHPPITFDGQVKVWL